MPFFDFSGFEANDFEELEEETGSAAGTLEATGAKNGTYHYKVAATGTQEGYCRLECPELTETAPNLRVGGWFKFDAFMDLSRSVMKFWNSGELEATAIYLRMRTDGRLEFLFDGDVVCHSGANVLDPARWYFLEVVIRYPVYLGAFVRSGGQKVILPTLWVDGEMWIEGPDTPYDNGIPQPELPLNDLRWGIVDGVDATWAVRWDDIFVEFGTPEEVPYDEAWGNLAVSEPMVPTSTVEEDEWSSTPHDECDEWPLSGADPGDYAEGYGVLKFAKTAAADVVTNADTLLALQAVSRSLRQTSAGDAQTGFRKDGGSAWVKEGEVDTSYTRQHHALNNAPDDGNAQWTTALIDLYRLYYYTLDLPATHRVSKIGAFVLYEPAGGGGGTGGVAVVPVGCWNRTSSNALGDAFTEQPNTWKSDAAVGQVMPAAGSIRTLVLETVSGQTDETEWEVYLNGESTGLGADTLTDNGVGIASAAGGSLPFQQGDVVSVRARRTGTTLGRNIVASVWVQYDA